MENNTIPPKIVIYGVGQFGKLTARIALEKGWTIVGAVNRAGPKVGQDLGRLLGLDRDIGVIVQDAETARFESMGADIAIMTISDFFKHTFPVHKKLLNAGLNVLCHGTQTYFPAAVDKSIAAELDAIAKANNVTITGGGIWDTSRIWLGIMVAGPCTKINSLKHTSLTAVDRYGADGVRKMGIGLPVEEFKQMLQAAAADETGALYKICLVQVLAALGYTVKGSSDRREPVIFEESVFCKSLNRNIEPGLCAGMRIIAEATTEENVTATASIETRLTRPGEVEYMAWAVDGLPSSRATFERDDTVHASASSLINRVRDVIAAPPGLVTVDKLGPMRHSALE